jgi:hypothetical protein
MSIRFTSFYNWKLDFHTNNHYLINVIRNPTLIPTEMDMQNNSELERIYELQTGQLSREEVDTYGGGSTLIYADEYVEWLEARLTAVGN